MIRQTTNVLIIDKSKMRATSYIKQKLLCPRPGELSDDAVWRLSATPCWLGHQVTYIRRQTAYVAGRLDGAYWLIGPGSTGLAQCCRCALPLQAWAGAYRGGRPPTACLWSCSPT